MVVLSFEEAEHYLELAVLEARQCLYQKVREVPICCFLINENKKIISVAHNQTNKSKNGSRHCELIAIDNYILGTDFEKKKNDNIIKCFNSETSNISGYFLNNVYNLEYCKKRNVKKEDVEKENVNKEDVEKEETDKTISRETDNEKIKAIQDRINHLKKCCIVVTCEPCGMCTYALELLGIEHIYFCCKNDRYGGCVSFPDIWGSHKYANLHFIESKCTEESISLLRIFYEAGNPLAPKEKRKRPLKEIEAADNLISIPL